MCGGRRAVGAVVGDDHQTVLRQELGQNCLNRSADTRLFVMRGYQYGTPGPFRGIERGIASYRKQRGPAFDEEYRQWDQHHTCA